MCNKTDAKYRKRGPEKNHRPDPIVEMGLLMGKNGLLTYISKLTASLWTPLITNFVV